MKVRGGLMGLVALACTLVALGLWLGSTTDASAEAFTGFPPCCDEGRR